MAVSLPASNVARAAPSECPVMAKGRPLAVALITSAPHRLQESLTDALASIGPTRRGAICREMTKTYEETIRGTIVDLLEWSRDREILGEITIVLEGFDPSSQSYSAGQLVAMVRLREAAGESRKDAISALAKELNLPKRIVFDAMVSAKPAER